MLHILLHYKLLTCTGSPNLLRQCVVWSSTAQGRGMDSVPGWCHKLLCIASTQYWHHGLLPTTHSHPLCSCSSNYSWVSSSRDFKIIYWSYARPPFGVGLCSIFRQPFSKVIWIVHFLGWHSLNWSKCTLTFVFILRRLDTLSTCARQLYKKKVCLTQVGENWWLNWALVGRHGQDNVLGVTEKSCRVSSQTLFRDIQCWRTLQQVACDWKSTCKRHVHCAVIDQFFYHSFYFVSFNKI